VKESINEDELMIPGDVLEEEFLDDIQSENLQPSFSSLNDISNVSGKNRNFQIIDKQQLSVISSRSEEESEDDNHRLSFYICFSSILLYFFFQNL